MPSNILLITADDMDGGTPASFGGPLGVTPSLDHLAAQGMTFQRAHVVAAVCQPSRSAIMSGKLPHRNGAQGFEPIHEDVQVLTDLLRPAGYLTGILGKLQHLQPVSKFGWDMARDRGALGMGRDPAQYGAGARAFFEEAQTAGRPWFLMANAHDPHRPFAGSLQETEMFSEEQRRSIPAPSANYSPTDHPVPGFLPDLPDVRAEYAEYLASSRRCDDVVAAVLSALDDCGQTQSTLVVFLSDNGMAFPFAKANCYLQSTRTPLIVRWPGVTTPGSVDDRSLVTMLDLLPTFCEAAGVEAPNDVDGASLLPLLRGLRAGSEIAFTVFHETSAKRRFEMRCAQDAHSGYIWNHWSDGETEYEAENMQGLTWRAMERAAGDDPVIGERASFYRLRTAEELYDFRLDPHSLDNLSEDTSSRAELDRLRTALLAWMRRHGDPLAGSYERFLAGRGVR